MIIILLLILFVLLAYLIYIKREIRNISKQLKQYNNCKSRKKIDVSLFDKDIENLAKNINDNIENSIQSDIKKQKAEYELKKTIANISHDIRTPLTSILGYIQMSKKMYNDMNKQKEYISIAEERSKQLQIMLNNLFSLSLIQSPDYKLELENINITNCLCEVITSHYEGMRKIGIEPKININDEKLIVVGNKQAICRVIENLITNIMKYSKGEEDIVLERLNNKAIIIISNKCENLKITDIEMLFDRFYKKDTSRNNINSTGLGLSIAKSLMELMDGDIEAKIVNDRIYIKCIWTILNSN